MAKIKAKKAVEETTAKTKKVKKSKTKVIKDTSFNENNSEIGKFIIIFVVILLVVVGLYFLSKVIVDKREDKQAKDDVKQAEINYDIITIGTLLNRPYDEYYVLAYDGETPDAIYYSSLITVYQNKENAKKIYYCDLSNGLNSKYVSATSNPDAKTVDELKLGKITLLTIKKGKIVGYVEDINQIQSTLQ